METLTENLKPSEISVLTDCRDRLRGGASGGVEGGECGDGRERAGAEPAAAAERAPAGGRPSAHGGSDHQGAPQGLHLQPVPAPGGPHPDGPWYDHFLVLPSILRSVFMLVVLSCAGVWLLSPFSRMLTILACLQA